MGRTVAQWIGIILAALLAGGCQSLLRPSATQRAGSFAERSSELGVAGSELIRSVYFVFSADTDPEPTFTSQLESFTVDFRHENTAGFAVAIDAAGYLLTAGHVAHRVNYVIGPMDGRIGMARADIVYKQGSTTSGQEYAVLHVDRTLDWPRPLAPTHTEGPLFCIGRASNAGDFQLLAGRIREARAFRTTPSGQLLVTDVPLWYGDSGGAAFYADGSLAGINTAFWFGLRGWRTYYERYVFAPDARSLAALISSDKQARALARSTPDPSTAEHSAGTD